MLPPPPWIIKTAPKLAQQLSRALKAGERANLAARDYLVPLYGLLHQRQTDNPDAEDVATAVRELRDQALSLIETKMNKRGLSPRNPSPRRRSEPSLAEWRFADVRRSCEEACRTLLRLADPEEVLSATQEELAGFLSRYPSSGSVSAAAVQSWLAKTFPPGHTRTPVRVEPPSPPPAQEGSGREPFLFPHTLERMRRASDIEWREGKTRGLVILQLCRIYLSSRYNGTASALYAGDPRLSLLEREVARMAKIVCNRWDKDQVGAGSSTPPPIALFERLLEISKSDRGHKQFMGWYRKTLLGTTPTCSVPAPVPTSRPIPAPKKYAWQDLPAQWWRSPRYLEQVFGDGSGAQRLCIARLDYIETLKPVRWCIGYLEGGRFSRKSGYWVADFDGVALAECIRSGNAIYAVIEERGSWREILAHTKQQARSKGAKAIRHDAGGRWRRKVHGLVRRYKGAATDR